MTSTFLGFASKCSHLPAAQHKGNREELGKLSTRSPRDYLQLGVSLRQGLLPVWHSEELTWLSTTQNYSLSPSRLAASLPMHCWQGLASQRCVSWDVPLCIPWTATAEQEGCGQPARVPWGTFTLAFFQRCQTPLFPPSYPFTKHPKREYE